MNNLVKKEEYAAVVGELSAQLKKIMEQSGDSWQTTVGSQYNNKGDIHNWQPGGDKFKQIDLGVDWPGKDGYPE